MRLLMLRAALAVLLGFSTVQLAIADELAVQSWQMARATVKGSVVASLAAAVPTEGAALGAVAARLVMWRLDLRRDVDAGDEIAVVYRRQGKDIVIGALTYKSRRHNKTYRAYRLVAPGETYASFWDERGAEVPIRLKSSPLRSYDQITALLKDRPTHKGMDFKTPTGTPLVAPRAGTVTRTDWRTHNNGHCIELQYADGVRARFLHLSSVKVRPGQRMAAGSVLGATGNTGRSTAPHLHYEISRGTTVLDPTQYHGTRQRQLPTQSMPALKKAMASMDKLLQVQR